MVKNDRPTKKSPNAPKRFRSAYIFFSQRRHLEIKSMVAQKQMKDFVWQVRTKMIADEWKSLAPAERKIYQDMSLLDKQRYNAEKAIYDGNWKASLYQKTIKPAGAPKRPVSAYLDYANTHRAKVARALKEEANNKNNKDDAPIAGSATSIDNRTANRLTTPTFVAKQKDFSKLISKHLRDLWSKEPIEVQNFYKDKAQKKAQQYMIEMQKWKALENDQKQKKFEAVLDNLA